MFSASPNRHAMFATILFLLVGLVTIGMAWGFQLIGGFVPCALCLEQRDPYYVALPLAFLALVGLFLDWPRIVCTGLLILAAIAMAYGAGLGIYQAGAEWDFWLGPSDCGAGGGAVSAKASDLMSQLQTTVLVSCTETRWRMFGLSFAGWNAVASTFLSLVALGAAVLCFRGGLRDRLGDQ